jgi:hypothetical protein
MIAVLANVRRTDLILVGSLVYLMLDLQLDWGQFEHCSYPIHKWLNVSYLIVAVSRCFCMAGTVLSSADTTDFLLNQRHSGAGKQILMRMTWLLALPLFAGWTMLGTKWLYENHMLTPDCLPMGLQYWFLAAWQLLSYVWVMLHVGLIFVAWLMESRIRKAEGDLRQIEDSDLRSRWGSVSQLANSASLPALFSGRQGLQPAEISRLPLITLSNDMYQVEDCPICLHALQPGDSVRQLHACSHTFHRACIDLWLLRCADCPMCKQSVRSDGVTA